MANQMKRHEFLLPFARICTRADGDAYDSIPFQNSESYGDEYAPALASPINWSSESVSVMAEAAHRAIPADLRANEENTVPSWLWRHQPRGTRRAAEADLRDIFTRVVGSAAAKAWKLGLFSSEKHARCFYDEARFALMQRHIGLSPEIIAPLGLTWAYGIEERDTPYARATTPPRPLTNAALDDAIGKSKDAATAALWKKLFPVKAKEETTLSLRLTDTAAEWHSAAPMPARAAIDVLAMRHNDGSINSDALRQNVRTLIVLLDLHDRHDVTITLMNLAPLLMAFGLAYDSEAGRAMAASLAALVTAECAATSAEMAGLRGMSENFTADREAVMRGLRNHRRAVYGDGNDYEKLSVLPAPLPLKNCPDLFLVAEAQRRWDDALDMARAFGLRATIFTDMTPSPTLAILMNSAAQGLEPMHGLRQWTPDADGTYRAAAHPVIGEALMRLNYPTAAITATQAHIVGSSTLRKAPALNPAALRARGLTDTAIEKIESYLPCVSSLRLAVTPWIVGMDFCRDELNVSSAMLDAPFFDLLKHLGYSDAEITAADFYVYGHGTARTAKTIQLRHRPLFACGDDISSDARLRMAAAVQSFISGDTGLSLRLPALNAATHGAETTLAAWRSGLKSLTIIFDPAMESKPVRQTAARRIKASAHSPAKPATPSRHSASKRTPLAAKKPASARKAAR